MMKIKLLAGAALAVFAVTGANAAIITTTWTGTVTSGNDSNNYFGGGSMAGKTFTATYVFNDAVGINETTAIKHSVRGGTNVPAPTPNLTATLTINNKTYSFTGSYYGELFAQNEPGSFYNASSMAKTSADFYLNNSVYDFNSAAYADLSFANYSGSVANAAGNSGVFSWGVGLSNRLVLKNSTYTITNAAAPGAVPEPATWAMMIGGFGAVGASMRYRRRKTSVSFA